MELKLSERLKFQRIIQPGALLAKTYVEVQQRCRRICKEMKLKKWTKFSTSLRATQKSCCNEKSESWIKRLRWKTKTCGAVKKIITASQQHSLVSKRDKRRWGDKRSLLNESVLSTEQPMTLHYKKLPCKWEKQTTGPRWQCFEALFATRREHHLASLAHYQCVWQPPLATWSKKLYLLDRNDNQNIPSDHRKLNKNFLCQLARERKVSRSKQRSFIAISLLSGNVLNRIEETSVQ